jgi:hypothetical protein
MPGFLLLHHSGLTPNGGAPRNGADCGSGCAGLQMIPHPHPTAFRHSAYSRENSWKQRITVDADSCATRNLPDGRGGSIAAAIVHEVALAELSDRFAIIARGRDALA